MSVSRHTAYNLVGALLPLALSLLTVPRYIALVGEARYGVLSVAFLLLGYFGLFDLGLGTATAQRIAAEEDADPARRATTFWTALAMNLALGVFGGLLLLPVALYFFGHSLDMAPALRAEMLAATPWLTLALPLATVSGVLTGALQGRSRFMELNLVSVLTSALTQLIPLWVAWAIGADLRWLLPAVVACRVVTIAILFQRCRVHVFGGAAPRYARTDARALLHFGGWVTVSALVGPLMVILDRFVIGARLGASAVTHYTVPFQLVEKTSVLPASMGSAVFPKMAESQGQARALALSSLLALAALMTPLVVGAEFIIGPFLRWWISPDLAAHATLPARLLLLGFWVNALARIPYVKLLAIGRPDLVAKCHLGELVPYLIALYAGLQAWGLPGAALVFSLRVFIDCGLLLHFSGLLRAAIPPLVIPLVLVLASAAMAMQAGLSAATYWTAATLLVLVSSGWAWASLPSEFRALALSPLRRWRSHP